MGVETPAVIGICKTLRNVLKSTHPSPEGSIWATIFCSSACHAAVSQRAQRCPAGSAQARRISKGSALHDLRFGLPSQCRGARCGPACCATTWSVGLKH
jgi:hypothetical protein